MVVAGHPERRRASGAVSLLAALALPVAASAQVVRLGAEFQVNTYTTQYQVAPAVAARADGGFVVAWASKYQDGSGYGIFARRFSSAGMALAVEFQVNTTTNQSQNAPAVAVDSDGDFVVVWQSFGQEGSSYGIFARRFSSAGTAVGGEFVANSFVFGNQYQPKVAASASGDFVIAWASSGQDDLTTGVFARRFSSAGTALAAEFRVNSHTVDQQDEPSVAADADGDFVVAWSSNGQDQYYDGVFARRFSSAGIALAAEFQVNAFTIGAQYAPSVATDADGDFVVSWTNYPQSGDDFFDIFARRFTSAGMPVAEEFRVNDFTLAEQRRPSVAGHGAGGFLVSWQSNDQDTSSVGVFARRLSNAGAAIGAEFQVHTYTSGAQSAPAAAAGGEGKLVVVWHSAHDGSSRGVFAQRLAAPAFLDVDGNLSLDALTDGLLLLRYLFGFRGATLVSGAVDLVNCTRCSAAAIEAHLGAGAVPLSDPEKSIRQGAEFQVNAVTQSYQRTPFVASDSDGDFVVVWTSQHQDGFDYGVFGRRFSSAGARLGAEFQVSNYTLGEEKAHAVAAETNGDFVVAWSGYPQDGSSTGIFARRFSSAGSPLAPEFQVNTYTMGFQDYPAVAADADGDFVVTWYSVDQDGSSYGIFARRFSSSGAPLGTEFQVNEFTAGRQFYPKVGSEADGDFVVVWESPQDGSIYGVFGRRFSSAGAALAVEFQVNTFTVSGQLRASLEMDPDGDFLAAWHSFRDGGSSFGIFARRFSSSGVAVAVEFQINTYTTGNQTSSDVASLADGTFVVAWNTTNQDGSGYGTAARRFTSTGAALSPEIQVNTYTASDQRSPRLTSAGSRFVVFWTSLYQDGSANGVFGQHFVLPILFDIDGNGSLEALSDGLLALRYLFGFRGATLISGAVGAGCARCDAPAIEAYLAGLTS